MKRVIEFKNGYAQLFLSTILLPLSFFLMSVTDAQSQLMIMDLVEFKAVPTDGGITLTWTVGKVDTNSLYIIERTGENGVTTKIGMVQGVTSFTDTAPLEGESKYQICLETNTTKICSNPLLVTFYNSRELALSPNPTSNVLQVHYKTEKEAFVQIQLFDQFGKLLEQHTPNTNAGGHHHINMNVNSYSTGFYFIRLIDGKAVETKQFYKQ